MTVLTLGSVRKIDNLDDRKQIVIQLDMLTEPQRIDFLKWAINHAPINIAAKGEKPLKVMRGKPGSLESPFPYGSSNQVYFDLMMAIQQHNVPIDIVLNELEQRARKKLI